MQKFDKIKFRNNMSTAARQAIISILAVAAALAISMIIIAAMGVDPGRAMSKMLSGALGNKNAVAETLVKMTPLLFTGISYALANRCGLTNIGMEGQLYMGALFATISGVYLPGLPLAIHLPLTMLAGFVGGGIWGWIVGVLKVRFGASEIITTVMLNTVAIQLVQFMVNGPITEPPGNDAQSSPLLDSARLPIILKNTRAHLGILIALLFVYLFWMFLWSSKKGYEIRVSGQNPDAALYSGINTKRNVVLVMLLAGGVAGLAGATEVMGVQGRLFPTVSPGYGFDGIAVALIGANTPLGIVAGAFLFGILRAGGNSMQRATGVPVAIIKVIQAIVILMVVATAILREVNLRRKKPEAKKA
ncbi:ABC transporter permease [Pseudoflavonifractor sp. 524-17]|uniref:ABC transporter permease n=1 Tax=Pseudoflavonifractor sp. 524-17 TaxID=2304577 RepID=UPI0013796C1B|nr:ABC transporter permease [Pseudoflavonifractor sp. 524-17]NCE64974.1 ABC transporter permease [Pseudoflavonifractor sp. 524-17]